MICAQKVTRSEYSVNLFHASRKTFAALRSRGIRGCVALLLRAKRLLLNRASRRVRNNSPMAIRGGKSACRYHRPESISRVCFRLQAIRGVNRTIVRNFRNYSCHKGSAGASRSAIETRCFRSCCEKSFAPFAIFALREICSTPNTLFPLTIGALMIF